MLISRRWLLAFAILLLPTTLLGEDWPQWRGPHSNNHAAPTATAPTQWSETSGIAWTTELPGRGNSSPTVVGDRIYLTTGDEEAGTQSLLILNRQTGELLKELVTYRGGLPEGVQWKNSHANATVACDGEHLFVLFLNDGAPTLTAYSLAGEQLWQRRTCGDKRLHFEYGFGSSPAIIDGMVVVATEYNEEGSGIYAYDVQTGETAWEAPRPNNPSYSTPAVAALGGEDTLLMCGNDLVAAYQAESGEELWSQEAPTMATCGTMVWDSHLGLGFASGGHPKQFTLAVNLRDGHEIVWQNSVKCYEQSLITVGGYVYAVSDRGVAYCWRGSDGTRMWKQRLGGNFSSSPLFVDGKLYVANEGGDMRVFQANPDRYVELGANRLGDACYATPAPADGRLYHRYGKDGKEYLAAIGP